jgi:hypothetical protein
VGRNPPHNLQVSDLGEIIDFSDDTGLPEEMIQILRDEGLSLDTISKLFNEFQQIQPSAEEVAEGESDLKKRIKKGRGLYGGGTDWVKKFFDWVKHRQQIGKHYEKNNSFKVISEDDANKKWDEIQSYKNKMYGGLLIGGELSIGNIKKMMKASYKDAPEKIGDFILDHDLSNEYAVVYYNPSTGQAVVCHRGTTTAYDWSNNLMYAVGRYKTTDRYKIGKHTQEKAINKYGAKNISTLGHSQGAALARELGKDTKEIITLNPAYKGEKPLKNEYNIRSSADVVSSGLWGTKRSHDLVIPAKGYNLLNEHMIDILDRVDQNKMFGNN